MDDALLNWMTFLCGLSMASYFGGRVAAQLREQQARYGLPSPSRRAAEDVEAADVPDMLEEEFQELERSVAERTTANNGAPERQERCTYPVAYA